MPNKFQSSAKNYTSSNKFVEDYEKLLKKNTGSSLLFAQDTGFNPAYNLTNQQVVAPLSAEGGLSAPQMSSNYQAPARRQYAPLPEAVEPEVLGASDELPENPTAQQMLQAIFKAAWEPELPTTEQLEQRFQETGEAYPIMSMEDGSVQYSDGSFRQMDPEEPPMPIASMADGSVLWSDGFTRERPADGLSGYLAGVAGLSQFIFGEQQTVTQDYGNYNPELGYGSNGHLGTDFRTRDLANRNLMAPVQMQVVQVITEDMGSPYGNSVLLQLPTGEMIRLSHLSTLGEFVEGQTLNAGDLIGVPGSTGNSTAEHLDVEYYNMDGQLSNPNDFKANVQQYSVANQITGTSPYNNLQSQEPQTQPAPTATQAPQQDFTNEMPAFTSPLLETAGNVAQAVTKPVQQAVQQVGTSTANAIDQWNPTGKLGVGATELLRGDVKGAQAEAANTINTLQPTGTFDLGLNEGVNTPLANQARLNTVATGSAGDTNPLRYLAGNVIEKAGDMIGAPEGTLSELVAGTQTRRTNVANASNGNYGSLPQSPFQGDSYTPNLLGDAKRAVDYGKEKAGNLLTTAAKSVDDYADKVTAQAGQGVSALKQGVQDIAQNIFKKPESADIGAKKMIGEDGSGGENLAPGSLLDMNKVGQSNDNRDAFFKYGGVDSFKEFIKPGVDAAYKGALALNLFKDNVFENADAVGNIFGSSFLGKEATDKYRSNEQSKYPLENFNPMAYEKGYSRSAIDSYNKKLKSAIDSYNNEIRNYIGSIPSVLSGANWQMGAPVSAKNMFADASLEYKTPEMQTDNTSRVASTPMSMARPKLQQPSISRPKINTSLMSMAKPNISKVSVAKPSMSISKSVSKPKVSISKPKVSVQKINTSLMSMAKPKVTVQKVNKSLMSVAKPKVSSSKKQPYAIMSMKNGQVKYSDGSIRNR